MALANAVSFVAASSGTGSFVFGTARPSFLTPAQAVTLGELVDGQAYSYLAQDDLSAPTQREWGLATFTAATSTFARTIVRGTVSSTGVAASGSPLKFSVAPTVSLTALMTDFGGIPTNGNLDFYVATTGSDSNPGTSALPFLTLQKAWDTAVLYNYGSTLAFTIHIADGTYSVTGKAVLTAYLESIISNVSIVGNTATPSNVVLTSNHDGIDLIASGQNGINLAGLKIVPGVGSYCIKQLGGVVNFSGNMAFGGSSISGFAVLGGELVVEFCTIDLTGVTNSSMGDFCDIIGIPQGSAIFQNVTIVFSPNFSITGNFAYVQHYGFVDFLSMTYTNGTTFTPATAARLSHYCILRTDNGLVTDFPFLTTTVVIDNTSALVAGGSNVPTLFGTGQRTVAGLPSATQLLPQTWGVFKDTSGGGVYVAANDGGSIKKVALT